MVTPVGIFLTDSKIRATLPASIIDLWESGNYFGGMYKCMLKHVVSPCSISIRYMFCLPPKIYFNKWLLIVHYISDKKVFVFFFTKKNSGF